MFHRDGAFGSDSSYTRVLPATSSQTAVGEIATERVKLKGSSTRLLISQMIQFHDTSLRAKRPMLIEAQCRLEIETLTLDANVGDRTHRELGEFSVNGLIGSQ